jgi:hypothetical protein
MLCAREARKFEPYGRQYCDIHPGWKQSCRRTSQATNGCNTVTVGPPLVRALRDCTITEQAGVRLLSRLLSLFISSAL